MAYNPNKVHEIATAQIINDLQAVIDGKQAAPMWERDWNTYDVPQQNMVSKRPYEGGLNVLLLATSGWQRPFWLTKSQAAELKGKELKKAGANVEQVTRTNRQGKEYKTWFNHDEDRPVHGIQYSEMKNGMPVFYLNIEKRKDKETGEPITVPIFRFYTVYNCQQTNLETIPELPSKKRGNAKPDTRAKRIIKGWSGCPEIRNGGGQAYYHPAQDYIQMPEMADFNTTEGYYGTLFHEMIHATGHGDRLNRDLNTSTFKKQDYSAEELTAELGAAMLRGQCGMTAPETDRNTVAYLNSWIKALKGNVRWISYANGRAAKATDYILNNGELSERYQAKPDEAKPTAAKPKAKRKTKRKAA